MKSFPAEAVNIFLQFKYTLLSSIIFSIFMILSAGSLGEESKKKKERKVVVGDTPRTTKKSCSRSICRTRFTRPACYRPRPPSSSFPVFLSLRQQVGCDDDDGGDDDVWVCLKFLVF